MTTKLSAIIEQDEHGIFAYCPELKGCHTQGDTMEEALINLKEAAELYLETMSKEEMEDVASKQIFSTSLEVAYA